MQSQAIGIDLGGTKIAAARVHADGSHGPISSAPTPAIGGAGALLDAIAAAVRQVVDDEPSGGASREFVGLGVAAAGVIGPQGQVLASTETLEGWVGTDIIGGLRTRIDWIRDKRVVVANDVDAHLRAEAKIGSIRTSPSAIMVAVGTGVGGALLLDGRLRAGAHHVAGEVGHIPVPGAEGLRCSCGVLGHLEALSSGWAIADRYRQASAARSARVDAREVARRAAEGDAIAESVLTSAAHGVGRAIAGMVTLVDPDAVVIGGGVAGAGAIWWQELERAYRAGLPPAFEPPRLLRSELGLTAGVVGAALPVFPQMSVEDHRA